MPPAQIHIFTGNDTFALSEARKKLEATVLDAAWSSFNLTLLGSDATAGQALAALQTMPLGAGGRLVIVTEPAYLTQKTDDPSVDDFENMLLKTPPAIPSGNHLLFIVGRIDQRLKLVKTLTARAELREFSEAKTWQLAEQLGPWTTNMAKQQGRAIARDAVLALLEATAGDRWRIQGELEKLALMLPEQAAITLQDIQKHVHHGDVQVFALTDAFAQRSPGACVEALARILTHDHPLKLMAALSTVLRGWTRQKELQERGMTPAQIAKETGARSDFKVRKDLESLRKWTSLELHNALHDLLKVDLAIKSGLWPPEHHRILLEKWCLQNLQPSKQATF
ncbi:MAG: DNA polymerase III subunit delta [Candidatus Sericytochromatia bacterium]|nr:DNA polymerase III subunit delta [Candidatus Sericytochromatia bacterium]